MDIILITPAELKVIIIDTVRKAISEQQENTVIKDESINQLLTVEQACEFLNLAKQTLYGFTSKREIPFIKRHKKLYFCKMQLINWLNEGKRQSISQIKAEVERRSK